MALLIIRCCLCLLVALALSAPRRAAAQMPDYAHIVLKGDGFTQDSTALALQAAARMIDRRMDYDTIACLTTNVFAPAVDPGEDCMAWWHVGSWLGDRGISAACARLGFTADHMVLPVFTGDPKADSDVKAHQQKVASKIRDAIDSGAIVLALGGWQPNGPNGFVSWCWAGIVTEARTDGTVLGATINGRTDNVLGNPGDLWVLTRKREIATPRAADLIMLRLAVDRIRSEKPFGPAEHAVFGLAAMDLWMKHMGQTPGFCAPCQQKEKNGWTCAEDNGKAMLCATRTVAAYLKQRAPDFPESARLRLLRAAQHYDKIAELLGVYDDSNAPKAFVGDLAKQKEHVSEVLKPVRDELSSAADELERALLATGS